MSVSSADITTQVTEFVSSCMEVLNDSQKSQFLMYLDGSVDLDILDDDVKEVVYELRDWLTQSE